MCVKSLLLICWEGGLAKLRDLWDGKLGDKNNNDRGSWWLSCEDIDRELKCDKSEEESPSS